MNWRREAAGLVADAKGRRAEDEAARFFEAEGYEIIARRLKTPRGEIDLVARRPGLLVCIEVKWRAKPEDLDFAIDAKRLKRVAAAAEIVFPRLAQENDDLRIDVVLLAPGAPARHIANAWMPC